MYEDPNLCHDRMSTTIIIILIENSNHDTPAEMFITQCGSRVGNIPLKNKEYCVSYRSVEYIITPTILRSVLILIKKNMYALSRNCTPPPHPRDIVLYTLCITQIIVVLTRKCYFSDNTYLCNVSLLCAVCETTVCARCNYLSLFTILINLLVVAEEHILRLL